MIQAFNQFISENNLCSPSDKILLAVSGGADSVVMLDLFKKSGFELAVAHCNFKLRGEESDEDEKFVRNKAEEYKSKAFFKSFETKQFAEDNKLSIQEVARILRYNWFNDLCREQGFSKIAVAHHKDDLTETFFINLFRGAGLKGLKGIPVKREKIIRPLLFASRKEIENYAMSRNLQFRSDSSNNSDKYLRNQIRHHLLPLIESLKPGLQKQIESSLQLLKEDHQVLEELLDEKRKKLFVAGEGHQKLAIEEIKGFSSPMVFYLLSVFGFNRSITDSILQSIQSGEIGKVFLSATHRLLLDRDFLILEKVAGNAGPDNILIHESDNKIITPLQLEFSQLQKEDNFTIEKEKNVAYFDFNKLSFPLQLRRWMPGDRFTPFGMKGSKLLSDLLIDEKVNLFEKENVWVLLSGEEIIWVVGIRASDKHRITSATGKVFRARLF
jgi:tRNA(Ile)-lysidine synthase